MSDSFIQRSLQELPVPESGEEHCERDEGGPEHGECGGRSWASSEQGAEGGPGGDLDNRRWGGIAGNQWDIKMEICQIILFNIFYKIRTTWNIAQTRLKGAKFSQYILGWHLLTKIQAADLYSETYSLAKFG